MIPGSPPRATNGKPLNGNRHRLSYLLGDVCGGYPDGCAICAREAGEG